MAVDIEGGQVGIATEDAADRNRPSRRRLVAMAAGLLAAYVVLALVLDLTGIVGADTGSKVATLETMTERPSGVPAVGYWAAAADRDAEVHPLTLTERIGDDYIAISTLPMLLVSAPLYRLGGPRLVLLLPMLGAVGCALAAMALARRLRVRRPEIAFWVIGLASPVVIYAFAIWEHTIGLALMLFGVVALIDATERAGGRRDALLAGACFGLAATLRTEALVYGALAALVLFASAWARHREMRALVAPAAAFGVAALLVLVANAGLERVVLGDSLRTDRSSGIVSDIGSELGDRVDEAVTTSIGVNVAPAEGGRLVGGLMALLLTSAGAGAMLGWPPRRLVALAGCAAALCVLCLASDLGFFSGLFTALPLASVGFGSAWFEPRLRPVAVIAVVALPVVWMVDYLGGAGPQWGGRYTLLSSTLLAILALATVGRRAPWLAATALGMGAAITVSGIAFLVERDRATERLAKVVMAADEDVVISRDSTMLRLIGAWYREDRAWLTAENDADVARALQVASATNADRIAVLTADANDAHRVLPGWREIASTEYEVLDGVLDVYRTTYVRSP